jgi:hypothetical protein
MAADLTLNRGDLFPPFKTTLQKQNETTGAWEAIDLTLAETVTVFLVCGTVEVEGVCTIASRSKGEVEYDWVEGDTNTAGVYQSQHEILWKNGKRQTVPNAGYNTVDIQPDLAGDA